MKTIKTKLWVDDVRDAPDDSWDVARNFHDAIHMLQYGEYITVSLDHDINSWYGLKEMTGRDILNCMVYRKINGKATYTKVMVHSANPVGAKYMREDIGRYFP